MTEPYDSVQGTAPSSESQVTDALTQQNDQPAVETTPDLTTQNTQPQPESNAPWQPFVEKFPEAYRGIATEAAKEWDAGVTRRFQDLHSTYEPYKPFIEQWEPSAIEQALALAEALESDPQTLLAALNEAYNVGGSEQGVTEQQLEVPPPGYDDPNDPYATQLNEQGQLLQSLGQYILNQENAKQQAVVDAENERIYAETMTYLKDTYGEFDQNYVNVLLSQGVDPEQAVKQFKSAVEAFATQQNAPAANAPSVMRAGGGLPSQQVDPTTLDSKATKDLVAQILAAGD